MPDYVRAVVPGGTFFFTVVTEDRAPILCDASARAALRDALALTRERWTFRQDAFAILPDHMHVIWTLPEGDADFSRRWAYLKKEFTKRWLGAGGSEVVKRRADGRRGVWQRRFWEHAIRGDEDLRRHLDYIHYNGVKHGHATCPHAWPHSPFTGWVERGGYERQWCCACAGESPKPPASEGLPIHRME